MGNSESSAPPEASIDDFDGVETLGYRVLGVQPNSPASAAGLVSFFDFLIGADNQMLLGSGENLQEGEEYDDVDFPALLEKFKGKTLQLLVWNIKCQQQRLVDIVPSDDWEGAGLLGVTIRLDNYAGAEDRLIRILTVEHNSPAAIAGLVSSQDYLLGTTTHSFDSTKVLAAVLEAHVDKVVELYVYNTNSDKVRVVALMPTWSWGGNGLLGAEVGTGYLHRLPGSCRDTLGGSVERRVRWIGGNKNGPPASNKDSTKGGEQQQTAASATTTPNNLQQAPTLELEPQLEMEQPPDDEEDDDTRRESMGTVSLTSQVSAAVEQVGGDVGSPPEKQSTSEAPTNGGQPQPEPTASSVPAEAYNNSYDTAPTTESNNGGTAEGETVTPPTTNGGASTKEEAEKEKAPNSGGVFIPAPMALQNLPPTTSAPVPAPFPIPAMTTTPEKVSSIGMPTDPAAQPITITTFIPGAKPPPLSQSISAEDLFSGPPPVAKIPTQASVVISSPAVSIGSPNNPHDVTAATTTPAAAGAENSGGSPAFPTPHPPSAIRPVDPSIPTPTPPVGVQVQQQQQQQQQPQQLVFGNGIDDIMPPPPKMSGAQQ